MTATTLRRINELVLEVRQLKGTNQQLRERNAVLERENDELRADQFAPSNGTSLREQVGIARRWQASASLLQFAGTVAE